MQVRALEVALKLGGEQHKYLAQPVTERAEAPGYSSKASSLSKDLRDHELKEIVR